MLKRFFGITVCEIWEEQLWPAPPLIPNFQHLCDQSWCGILAGEFNTNFWLALAEKRRASEEQPPGEEHGMDCCGRRGAWERGKKVC